MPVGRRFSRKKMAVFASIPCFLLGLILYAGSLVYRAEPVYKRLKTPSNSARGTMVMPHSLLGSVPLPNSQGEQLFPHGPPLPLRLDQNGFRIPATGSVSIPDAPALMTVGCSHTFGHGVPAADTFPHLAGKALAMNVYNAGVRGWGLARMLGYAREIVPAFKPEILVVQYSPWLADRATTGLAPNYFQKFPIPYFTDRAGNLELVPPAFTVAQTKFSRFRDTDRDGGDFMRFLLGEAGPCLVHDDLSMLGYRLRHMAGRIPKMETDKRKVEKAVYAEFAEIAKTHGTRMYVLVLGWQLDRVKLPDGLVPAGVPIIHAHNAMIDALPTDVPVSQSLLYGRHYFQFRGDSPQIVDSGHPNDQAHAVIAEALVEAIRNY